MSALRAFEGYGVGFERWTDEASTAARALRLGGATATGYRGRPPTGPDAPKFEHRHRLHERRAESDRLVQMQHDGVLRGVRRQYGLDLRMVLA